MLAAYESGDPYLSFAIQAGAVPAHATKATHGPLRELFKTCALAVQYGMGPEGLAARIGKGAAEARELLRLHHMTYPRFWRWSDAAVDHAYLYNQLRTVFGWTLHLGPGANPRSLRNFVMQANGAEMLRLACSLVIERGVRICAPVHDAILVEAPLEEIDAAVAVTQNAMADASEIVLGGVRLRSEAHVVRYPTGTRTRGARKCGTPYGRSSPTSPGGEHEHERTPGSAPVQQDMSRRGTSGPSYICLLKESL
jgi:DNA polymerase-1